MMCYVLQQPVFILYINTYTWRHMFDMIPRYICTILLLFFHVHDVVALQSRRDSTILLPQNDPNLSGLDMCRRFIPN